MLAFEVIAEKSNHMVTRQTNIFQINVSLGEIIYYTWSNNFESVLMKEDTSTT